MKRPIAPCAESRRIRIRRKKIPSGTQEPQRITGKFRIKRKKRHNLLRVLLRRFILAAALSAGLAGGLVLFLLVGETWPARLIRYGTECLASRMSFLSLHMDDLSGSFRTGLELRGFSLGDKKTPAILSLKRFSLVPDLQESWRQKRFVFRTEAEGLRIRESLLDRLAKAAAREFPAADASASPKEQNAAFALFDVIAPQSLKLKDFSGTLGWKLADLTLNRKSFQGLSYDLSAQGQYQRESLKLRGSVDLTPSGLPQKSSLRLQGLESDVRVTANMPDATSLNAVLEGTLLKAALRGQAALQLSGKAPRLNAAVSMTRADLSRLRRWIPGLDSGFVDEFSLSLTGPLQAPHGAAMVKNASAVWRRYRLESLSGRIDLKGSEIQTDLRASLPGGEITLQGTAGTTPQSPVSLTAVCPSFQLSQLARWFPELTDYAPEGALSAEANLSGTLSQPRAQVRLSAPLLSLQKDYSVTNLEALLLGTPSELTVDRLTAEAFQGKLSLRGTAGLAGKDPPINISGRVQDLDLGAAVPGGSLQGRLSSDFSLSGTVKHPEIRLSSQISRLDAAQFGAKNIELDVQGSDTFAIRVKGVTKFNNDFSGGGTVRLPSGGAPSDMDLLFRLDSVSLTELFPNTMKFSGALSMDISAKGPFDAPRVTADLKCPELEMKGYRIMDTQARAELKGKSLVVDASVMAGDRRPQAKIIVDLSKGLKGTVDVSAQDILISELDPSLKNLVQGRASFTTRGTVTEKGAEFSGEALSPELSIQGLRLSDVKIPYTFHQGILSIADGRIGLGGTLLTLKAQGDTSRGTYTFSTSAPQIDLQTLTSPMALPARIEGKSSVSFEGKMRQGTTTVISGQGKISLRDIAVDQFPGQAAVTGKDPFRVKSGSVHFTLSDGEVYVMPGSSLSAPSDDRFYRYLAFSGTLWNQKKTAAAANPDMIPPEVLARIDPSVLSAQLNPRNDAQRMYHMYCSGRINMRALNSLFGGLGVILDNTENIARGKVSAGDIGSQFLQKMITKGIVSEFRDFNLDVYGKDYSDVHIGRIKFEGDGSRQDVDSSSWTDSGSERKETLRYKISYPVYLGPDPSKPRK